MGVQHPHTKLLTAAAREVLRSLGLVQQGRSRTWLDDRGWWVGVVGFQPSSFSRGSYLNVGVNWLWTPEEDLANDLGGRVAVPGAAEYIEYVSDEQFAPLARELALVAAERVRHYRDVLPTVAAAASVLMRAGPDALLDAVNAGIAFGLTGDPAAARMMFARYVAWFESDDEMEWRTEIDDQRYKRASHLSDLVADRQAFRDLIRMNIRERRERIQLDPEVELPF